MNFNVNLKKKVLFEIKTFKSKKNQKPKPTTSNATPYHCPEFLKDYHSKIVCYL